MSLIKLAFKHKFSYDPAEEVRYRRIEIGNKKMNKIIHKFHDIKYGNYYNPKINREKLEAARSSQFNKVFKQYIEKNPTRDKEVAKRYNKLKKHIINKNIKRGLIGAGVAALGVGAGIAAYKHHKDSK